MGFKDNVEQHPVIVIGAAMIVAFGAGIGVITFLDNRDEKLKTDIINQLTSENIGLKEKQTELEKDINKLAGDIKQLVQEYISQQAEIAKLSGTISAPEIDNKTKILKDKATHIDTDEILEHGIFGGQNSVFRKPFG